MHILTGEPDQTSMIKRLISSGNTAIEGWLHGLTICAVTQEPRRAMHLF